MNTRQKARKLKRRRAHGAKPKPEAPPVIQTVDGPIGEAELNAMTIPALKEMATTKGVDFKSKDKKSSLVDKLLGRHRA